MSRHLLRLLCATIALILSSTHVEGQQRNDRITTDLDLEWERVDEPQISPDGRQIIYTRQ